MDAPFSIIGASPAESTTVDTRPVQGLAPFPEDLRGRSSPPLPSVPTSLPLPAPAVDEHGRGMFRLEIPSSVAHRVPAFGEDSHPSALQHGGLGVGMGAASFEKRRKPRASPPPPVLCEDNLRKLGRMRPDQRLVQDPCVYRPATPILEWQTPKRSATPPKLPMWLVVSAFCCLSMILTGFVPRWLSESEITVFLCVFIPCSTVITAFVTYMSITRHLQEMVALMRGINGPSDIDRVVEKLENGRFSRLREPWFVQVHTIRMFCRLLKFHHGVNPVSGELIPPRRRSVAVDGGRFDDDECSEVGSAAVYSCFSGGGKDQTPGPGSVADAPQGLRRPGSPVGRRLRSADPLGDNAAGWEQVMGAPPENRNLIFEILKQIKPGMEMSKIPLPAHILEPRSVLERISDMFTHPSLFGQIAAAPTPRERLVALLRWYMSSLHVKPRGLKKPYNPVLGETFECYFAKGTPDEVHFFAEQVGHHPPVSVFTAVHASGLSLTGSYMLKGRLASPNCACISVDGRIDMHIPIRTSNNNSSNSNSNRDSNATVERWSLSFPAIFISSLLTTPRIEAGGAIKFTSPTAGCSAELFFSRKPFFGGSYDEVRGSVHGGGGPLTIAGKWAAQTFLEDGGGGRTILFDSDSAPEPLRPFAPDTVFPSPSRAVWERVTVALRAMDSEAAQTAKNTLEASQREIRRAREARGEEYLPQYFRIVKASGGGGGADDQWLYVGPSLSPEGEGDGHSSFPAA